VFFFALGYGARLLRPLFAAARSWRILDFVIGIIMWAIALRLLALD
jgi:L-lysine exporter family protein LysE/ArgO